MKFPVKDVTDLDITFGHVDDLMPPYGDIPKEFRGHGDSKWLRLQRDWFFRGLKSFTGTPKDGIDTKKALRHLNAIQRSFAPKHEHKAAAVAYLLSEWFVDVEWEASA